MALPVLRIRPGVNTQFTPTMLEAGWAATDKVRYHDGLLQKIGGWAKVIQQAFTGICRGLHSWTQINGLLDMGVGTHLKLWLYQLGSLYDLTPVRASGALGNNPFTTTNGSAIVTVHSVAHGLSVGDFVELAGTVLFNNVTMNGEFAVVSVVDVDNYTITATTVANANGAGGGAGVTFQYLLPVGTVDTVFLQGYGTGPFGAGPYGQASGSGYASLCRLWAIDNWGEFMLANPQNGGIYQWRPQDGVATRASLLTNAPVFNRSMLVASAQQQVIALGAETGGVQDPMLVRFSDVGNNTTWAASASNQAGSFRLARGSEIMNAWGSALTIIIWTNEGLWVMQYIGPPLVYSFVQVGFGCGLIAPKAAASTPKGLFWMEESGNFFKYDGSVGPLPCTVRDKVFNNINVNQSNKIFCALNTQWSEVWWFYPSLNSAEIDSYVKYNYDEETWDYGTCSGGMVRTAWEDHENFQYPIAAGIDSFLYNHENGVDADGQPLHMTALTGYARIADGEDFPFFERFLPDSARCTGPYTVTIFAVDIDASSDAVCSYGPFTVTPGVTPHCIVRARNREFAVQFESNVVGGNFRMGAHRAKFHATGRKR